MKKSMVTLLLIVGLVAGGQSAFAVATTVDFDTALSTLASIPIFGASWAPAVADADDNGMLESYELKVLSTILADAGHAQHAAAYTAWATNTAVLAQVKAAMLANATFNALFGANANLVADTLNTLSNGLVVMGDAGKIAAVQDIWDILSIPPANQTALLGMMVKMPTVFGTDGNFDGDTYTNVQEYAFATSQADYVARSLRNDPPPSLGVSISKSGTAVVPSGSTMTFTAAAHDGTAPYTYTWKLDGAVVGSNSATLSLAAALADDGKSVTCSVVDTVSAVPVVSNAIVLDIIDSAALPVMGIAGAALLIGLAGALGVRKIRK